MLEVMAVCPECGTLQMKLVLKKVDVKTFKCCRCGEIGLKIKDPKKLKEVQVCDQK